MLETHPAELVSERGHPSHREGRAFVFAVAFAAAPRRRRPDQRIERTARWCGGAERVPRGDPARGVFRGGGGDARRCGSGGAGVGAPGGGQVDLDWGRAAGPVAGFHTEPGNKKSIDPKIKNLCFSLLSSELSYCNTVLYVVLYGYGYPVLYSMVGPGYFVYSIEIVGVSDSLDSLLVML
jgi:hypothetical protein